MEGSVTRILVVDDEPIILTSFAKAFERAADQYEIRGVGSGDEALEALAAEAFDLVFTDLKMPGMDGLEVIRRVRAEHPSADVVMMTGYSTVETAIDAMKEGALDYVLKPFTQDELFGIVRKAERIRHARLTEAEEQQGFERWPLVVRVQHIVLMLTFILLTVTGVPLLFPAFFEGMFFFEDSSFLRGLIHRIAGVATIALGILHVSWGVFTRGGRRGLGNILFRLADFKEVWHLILYTIGLRAEKPRAGRYDFFEKFEYFAVVWGTIVMVITGLMLWFAEELFRIIPLWVLDVAKVIHRYEAILAILTIAIWHTYHVHVKPGVFPGNTTWWNGRVSREYMIDHHPLEYEDITGRSAIAREDDRSGGEEVA
jgi:CheY-like chemotaxis protein